MSNHNLWLRHNFPKKDIDIPALLIIQYKGSLGKKQTKTHFKVAPKHWNSKSQRINPEHLSLYPNIQEGIDSIKTGFTKQYDLLNKGEVTVQTVFDNLTFKRDLSGSIREFLNKTSHYSKSTINSYLDKLNGIEKYVGSEIKINQIGDRTEVLKIKMILESTPQLGNGGASYMKMLRTLSNNWDFKTKEIYKDAIPKTTESIKDKGFTPNQIKMGMNNIQTVAQLEAYLLWLYSFCLRGMTGKDIPNLDEESLEFENEDIPFNHYHSLGDSIKSTDPKRPSFTSKIHYSSARGKTGVHGKRLYNAFPTLFIKEWLRYCIGVAHPQYAYKGDDRIRLYNFQTKTNNNTVIPEGEVKWKKLKDVYYPMYKKQFGGSLHTARHTYQDCMERLGLSDFEQKRQIDHKVSKKALAAYAGKTGFLIQEDINQINVIEEFDMVEIVKMLCTKFIGRRDIENRPYSDNNIQVEFLLFSVLSEFKMDKYNWTGNDEKTYRKLIDALKFKGKLVLDKEKNEWVNVEPKVEDYEGQLLSYHNRREEFIQKSHISLENPSKSGIKFKFRVPEWAKDKLNEGISVPKELLETLKENKVEELHVFKENVE